MQETAQTSTTSASGAHAEAGTSIPSDEAADHEREGRDEGAVQHHGHRAAEEERQARAGETRIEPSVCWKRSPPIAKPIANTHGIAAYWSALPIT